MYRNCNAREHPQTSTATGEATSAQGHPPLPLVPAGERGRTYRLGNAVLRLVFVPVLFEPDKILKIGAVQEGIVRAFVADSGEWLGAVIVAGIHFHAVIELHDDLEQAVELLLRVCPLRKRAANTTHEQRITGDQLPVDQQTNSV